MGAELVERFYAAFDRRDGEAMAACYSLPAPVLEDAAARLAVAWRSVSESAPLAAEPAPALVA
jgi:hypothetical protein